jgi:hypothetical protein
MTTTHPVEKKGTSQALLILGRLSASPGEWVSLIDLWQASGSMAVHSRITDLRKLGYRIEHRNVWPKDQRPSAGDNASAARTVHSFYRLITG